MRAINRGKGLWIAGLLLAFLLGMGANQGAANMAAIRKVTAQVNGDCSWTIRHELWRQKNMPLNPGQKEAARP